MNYRNHRKIVVIDGVIGYTGGINIGDEYIGKNKKFGYWRDTHIRVQGTSVYMLQMIFSLVIKTQNPHRNEGFVSFFLKIRLNTF